MVDSTVYKGRELHYTEFNSSPSSRDPIHDSYQNAAWLLTTLKKTTDVASSMSYWTFTDIFEEAGPAMTSFHGGFGLLTLQGIKKPTFYSYKFLGELGNTELQNIDTCSWVCKNEKGVQALFWNLKMPFNDTTTYDDVYFSKNRPAADAGKVNVHIDHVPNGKYRLTIYKTGYKSNDPFTAYLEMGSPSNISLEQEASLKKISSGQPVVQQEITVKDGNFRRQFPVRDNDVYFIKLTRL